MGLFSWIGKLFKRPPPKWQMPTGIPPTLPDGRPNPMWQWMQTGMIPGSDQPTTTNTQTSQSGSSSTFTDMLTTMFSKGQNVQKPVYFYGGEQILGKLRDDINKRLDMDQKVSRAEQMGVINSILEDTSAFEKGLTNKLSQQGALGSPLGV